VAITKRLGSTLLMCTVLVTAATISFGVPRPAAAAHFFVGGVPTLDDGEAVVGLLAWLAIAGITILAIVDTVITYVRRAAATSRTGRATLVLVAGLLVLGTAFAHRTVPSYTLCCGGDASQVREVIDLAR
jgi:hypothetical protein